MILGEPFAHSLPITVDDHLERWISRRLVWHRRGIEDRCSWPNNRTRSSSSEASGDRPAQPEKSHRTRAGGNSGRAEAQATAVPAPEIDDTFAARSTADQNRPAADQNRPEDVSQSENRSESMSSSPSEDDIRHPRLSAISRARRRPRHGFRGLARGRAGTQKEKVKRQKEKVCPAPSGKGRSRSVSSTSRSNCIPRFEIIGRSSACCMRRIGRRCVSSACACATARRSPGRISSKATSSPRASSSS